MFDGDKIIPGLLLFLGLLALPFLYAAVMGKNAHTPELEIVTSEKKCVEPSLFMRKEHMNLLKNYWRPSVVREGKIVYEATDGTEHVMSLTGTCLKCHPNKANFCDRCHCYV